MSEKLDMRVIEARESVRAAVLALPRTIPWGDVADAAGVTHATLRRFVRTPEKTRIETVTAIAGAVEKLRAREVQK